MTNLNGSFFYTLEGQGFGDLLQASGEDAFAILGDPKIHAYQAAACIEFLAKYHGGLGLSGACYFAEYWAYKRKFMPDDSLRNAALEAISKLREGTDLENAFPRVFDELEKLLSAAPARIKWKDPTLSLRGLKKLVKDDLGMVLVEGTRVTICLWGEWAIDRIVQICNFPDVDGIASGFEWREPEEQEALGLAMLLHRYKNRLDSLSFDRSESRPGEVRDPYNVLVQVRAQLAELEKLTLFSSQHLYVDDSIVEALASERLEFLSVRPSETVRITSASISKLQECDALGGLSVRSDLVGEIAYDSLLERRPSLNLDINGKLAGWGQDN